MNSIRFRLAFLLVVAALVINALAVAVMMSILEPRMNAATMVPIARQIETFARVAEEDPEAVRRLGAEVLTARPTGAVDERATEAVVHTLAALSIDRQAEVLIRNGAIGATALVKLDDGAFLALTISDLGSQSSGYDALVIWLSVLTIGTGLVSFYAAWRVTVPLKLLHDTMLTIGTDGVPAPLPEGGPIEVKQTAMAINRLSDRLRKSIASRMRVVAAAGHDLRTPMTRMRLRAEFIADDEDRAKWLNDLAELEGIANSAIRLVREETGSEDRALIRLDEHLREITADLQAAGHAVTLSTPPALSVRAGPIALRRALTNLIVNAATHGGGARVSLRREGENAAIRIDDDGAGIPEELIEQVFEPFFSVDPARRRTVPGAGLGLSIAKSILERFNGTICIANRKQGGLEQRILLPLARPDGTGDMA